MSLKDLHYAARTLRNSPVFTLTAVITIALGIAASTAVFSVTNAVLLQPLPYKDPDRLVVAVQDLQKRGVKDFPFSSADFIDLRNGTRAVLEDLAAVNTRRAIVPKEDGTPEQIRIAQVTHNLLHVLGAHTVAGRGFTEADGQPPPPGAAQPVAGQPAAAPTQSVILSYEYWKRRFGADTNIIGQPMPGTRPGGTQVVGVLAPGFELLFPPDANMERVPDVFYAARIQYDAANRNNVWLRVIGRLKNGETLTQAQSAVDLVTAELRRNFIIQQTAGVNIRLEPMKKHIVEEVRPAILALMGAVTFLWLIACANVANLLLVRAWMRERELAVRTAIGATWWRLARQMLAEAGLLATLGTAAGLALAVIGVKELIRIAPANLPRVNAIRMDPVVLAFSVFAGAAAALIFGLIPIARSSRPDVMNVLRSSGRAAGLHVGHALRSAVVFLEVALCFVLLVGSGLMIRSFVALQHVDPGYDPHGLLTFQIVGARGGATPEARAAFIRNVRAHLQEIPGVQALAAAVPFPLTGGFSPIRWGLEAALADPSRFQAADWQIVLPGYFEAMHTRLIAGRTFTEADNVPGHKVIIVDEALAAKAFPNESAVGKRILVRLQTPEPEWVEIIGVVGHQRHSSLAVAGREQLYVTDAFIGHGAVQFWGLRTAGDPAAYAPRVRAAIAGVDPRLLMTEVHPMDELMNDAQAATRFQLMLIGIFAVVAVVLAAVGLYGVLATLVRQRTAEIGVRMALGADPSNIFKLVVGHGFRLSAAGIGAGLVAALLLTQLMTSMLVGVKPGDPITFVATAALLVIVAMLASWIPARRASMLDPTRALREE